MSMDSVVLLNWDKKQAYRVEKWREADSEGNGYNTKKGDIDDFSILF